VTDSALDILKLVLLALLYLFFARVLWAVWSEVRPARASTGTRTPAPAPVAAAGSGRRRSERREPAPHKGKRGRVARLVVLEPKERRGTAFALDGELTIGREENCTITLLGDTYVSGVHARVFDHDGQPMVEDLGSTNGSFHNGNKLVGARLLHPGDRIQIGFTVLEAQ
jgi:hypothetical protein